MKKNVDIKSMLIGAGLGAVVMMCVAAASSQNWTSGRYQLVVSDHYAYRIDTATGQIWQASASSLTSNFKAPVTEK